MAYQMKEMNGSMFPNTRKRGPNDPDLTGKVLINGQTFYVSGWAKPGTGGKGEWISIALKPAGQAQGGNQDGGWGDQQEPPPRQNAPQQPPQQQYRQPAPAPQQPTSRWGR